MNNAIRILRNEHRSISAVLQGLQHLARMALEPNACPVFEVFREMIRYMDAFPERLHHPKEDDHLFKRLERRAPESVALVEELRAEHVTGAKLIRELEQAGLAFERSWPAGGKEFIAAVDGYAEFQWNHMLKEEQQLLPLAERHLSEEDWRAIEEAFAGNKDPIADLREQDFSQLFTRIVNLAPAPLGLGPSWKQVSGRRGPVSSSA